MDIKGVKTVGSHVNTNVFASTLLRREFLIDAIFFATQNTRAAFQLPLWVALTALFGISSVPHNLRTEDLWLANMQLVHTRSSRKTVILIQLHKLSERRISESLQSHCFSRYLVSSHEHKVS